MNGRTLALASLASLVLVPVELRAADPEPAPSDDDTRVIVVPGQPREPTATRVQAEDARVIAGSQGDVVRVVENLPGVARQTAGSGQLVVWGASPQDTRIYVDGVPMPRLYHEGGLRSVVLPALVDAVDLVPGGQGAMWGRGLGGLVAVSTRTPRRDRVGGRVAADILDASAMITAPLDRRRRWHIALGGRGSYVAAWGRRVIDPRTAGLVPLPSYGDGQLRLSWQASSRDAIEIVAIGSGDRYRRGVPDPDPALAISDRRSNDFGRMYARWVHVDPRGTTVTVTPYVGLGRSARSTAVGPLITSLASEDVLAGLRANSTWRPRPWLTLDVGLDAEVSVVSLRRRGTLGLPQREGDIRVFGQPPPDDDGSDRWRVTRVGVAPYVQAEVALWDGRLAIVPGLRLDPYLRAIDRRTPAQAATPKVGTTQQDFAAEPRLAIVGRPAERVELRAAVGLQRQSPAPEDLSATFGSPGLPTSKALHVVIGVRSAITRTLAIDVTGFFLRSRDLAMRSAAASPLVGRALVASGTGRTFGVQALLRLEPTRGVFGWVAYTLMRAERRDRPDVPVRLSDYDQTHVLTALVGWALPRGFSLGARIRYATGFPRTPVVGAWFDATRNRYQPEFGAHNSIRIPAFAQLDARLAKRFSIARSQLEAYVEVLDVWNRRNAEELVYSADYGARGVISGVPILPSVGVQWDF